MKKAPLQDYSLGRAHGQAKGSFGKVTEVFLVMLIAIMVRFVMIVTEVTIVSIPVVDPLLKSAYRYCDDLVRDHYYN